ncbi:MAG TPA: molybdopterin-dependent oxidoreductase [Acidobacteriota bacterium]|nr:molybdopterin-dependent oxidoreductase [Acidobacteriota bacterium]
MGNERSDIYERFARENFRGIDQSTFTRFDRRRFLQSLGGIVVLLCFRDTEAQEPDRPRGRLPEDLNAFLRIDQDGKVTGFTGKIEMGQGVMTSLAQMLAEELNVPLERVEMVMGDTRLCPWDMGTFGSMTTRFFAPAMRAAAAEARAILTELAAERMGVSKDRLRVEEGYVVDPQTGNRISYGELARGERIVRQLDYKPQPEEPEEFNLVGKPLSRRDAVEKVQGKALYAGDIRVENMLYAAILRPPAHGAKLQSADTVEAEAYPRAQVVRDGDLVAVLHEAPDLAREALGKVRAEWDEPTSEIDHDGIWDHLLSVAPQGEVVASGGDVKQGEKEATDIVEAVYYDSYTAHAPIEPHTALAVVQNDEATIWASTQTPFPLQEEAATLLGLPAEKVRVITPYVGGGFGGKSNNRQALEAVRLARLVGRPVQVQWSREEEFFFDTFRPAAVVKIRAGVDTRSGRITFWDYEVFFAGQRGSEHFYDIPHHRTVVHGPGWVGPPGSHFFATGPWRAPSNNTNSFARESHIDRLASVAGLDPLQFRLLNLKDERMKRVVETVAEHFGRTWEKAPSSKGYGLACGIDAGTYVAHAAEIEVDKRTGRIRVNRVVCAQDMGLCVNPEGARMQMEGCITMGLGYALQERLRFQGGKILDRNFNSYQIPRFSWLPNIETVIVPNRELSPQGGGEPAIICMGGLLANAFFDKSGVRLDRLPITAEDVKKATRQGHRAELFAQV